MLPVPTDIELTPLAVAMVNHYEMESQPKQALIDLIRKMRRERVAANAERDAAFAHLAEAQAQIRELKADLKKAKDATKESQKWTFYIGLLSTVILIVAGCLR